jgi:glutamine amidotransferase
MIAVINYGQAKPVLLLEALAILNIDYIFTENEIEITRADKVIFHSDDSPEILIRKLHFENLFSLLRICQKPMLVIGLGFSICGEKIVNLKQVGLGLVHREVSILEKEISGSFNIEVIKENEIFKNMKANKFSFNSRLFLPQDSNTIAVISIDGVKYSAAMQKGNLTGIQFYPENSGEDGLTVLSNWNNSY